MAIDDAIEKIEVWASSQTALLTDPESVGIDRAEGWDVQYEQVGGLPPQMQVMQELMHELTSAIVEARDNGLPFDWDERVDYIHPAFVKVDGEIYVSVLDNGPATGNAAQPSTPAATGIWKEY